MNVVKFAFRQLGKDPRFTAVALVTLALCLGANVVIFVVVDSILLRPLPFPEPERLVTTVNAYPQAGVPRASSSVPNYYDRRTTITSFQKMAAIRAETSIVGEEGSPKRIAIERVTFEFFETLGVVPALGRFFTEEEMEPGRSQVVILTHDYWRTRFQANPAIVGDVMRVDRVPFTIVGVLPAGFRYLSSSASLFLPLASRPEDRSAEARHGNNINIVARLKPGATPAMAQEELNALNTRQMADDPYAEMIKGSGYRTDIFFLHADHVREIRPTLLLLQGGVLALFLIGAVNLINLLLIRALGRVKEFGVRQALGAGRWEVARHLLLETVLLTFLGGVLGLASGAVGLRLLNALGIDRLPLGRQVTWSARAMFATLGVSLLAGVVLALPLIWFNLRGRLAQVLQTETRTGTISHPLQQLRYAFIVGQVALTFALLVGAGMLGRSLQRVLAVSPGFQPAQVLTAQLQLPQTSYQEPPARLAFIERLLEELGRQPGVLFAGISSALPLNANSDNNAVSVEGQVIRPGTTLNAHYTSGSAGAYWSALGVPLRAGRFLELADNHRDQWACLVDEDFAKRYWPAGDVLGRRLTWGPTFIASNAFTIVGVVGRVKHTELGDTVAQGAVYFPYRQYAAGDFFLVVRTKMAPDTFAFSLRQTVRRLDPELPVDDLRPMEVRVRDSLIPRRSPALLAAVFAAVALLLAAIGTYGVLAFAVSQRRREIGVRMALGALPGHIQGQFLRVGGKCLAWGLLLGCFGAWAVVRSMKSVLFEAGSFPFDVLSATASAMILVVLLACWLPARRAARTDPMKALRYD